MPPIEPALVIVNVPPARSLERDLLARARRRQPRDLRADVEDRPAVGVLARPGRSARPPCRSRCRCGTRGGSRYSFFVSSTTALIVGNRLNAGDERLDHERQVRELDARAPRRAACACSRSATSAVTSHSSTNVKCGECCLLRSICSAIFPRSPRSGTCSSPSAVAGADTETVAGGADGTARGGRRPAADGASRGVAAGERRRGRCA